MNKTLLTTLIFALLLLFIFSPFAALAGLMLVLLFTAFLFFLGNVFRAIIGNNNTNSNSP